MAARVLKTVFLVLLVVVAVAFGTLVWFVQTGRLKSTVERLVSTSTGREFTLGDIDVNIGRRLGVTLTDARLANPSWARKPELFAARRAEFQISWLPLLAKRLVLPVVRLEGPSIDLEEVEGKRTWAFGKEGEKQSTFKPEVEQLALVDGELAFFQPASRTDVAARFHTQESGELPLVADVTGTAKGSKVKARFAGGSVLGLADLSQPYPMAVDGTLGSIGVKAKGTVAGLATLANVDMQAEVRGDSLADLNDLIQIALPGTPPYRVAAHVTHSGNDWRADDLRGKLGDSDVAGSVAYRMPASDKERAALDAKLVSATLDFDDLGPLIGAPPKTKPGETASAKQRQKAAEIRRTHKVLPQTALGVEHWPKMNATVRFDAKKVLHPPALPIDSMSMAGSLEDNRLSLDTFKLGVAGGTIAGKVVMDARKAPLAADVALTIDGLQLSKLFPTVQQMKASVGRGYGAIRFKGRGESIANILGTADGQLQLAVANGVLPSIIVEGIGLDLGEVVARLFQGNHPVDVRCVVANFDIKSGRAEASPFVLDTQDTLVLGEGFVDLGTEKLDLRLKPLPKDWSLFSLRTPINLRGELDDVKVRPDAGPLLLKTAAAVALGVVNPLLAVAPFVETGPGKDSQCGELLAKTKAWAAGAGAGRTRAAR